METFTRNANNKKCDSQGCINTVIREKLYKQKVIKSIANWFQNNFVICQQRISEKYVPNHEKKKPDYLAALTNLGHNHYRVYKTRPLNQFPDQHN